MKAIIEFNLPEEREDFRDAQNGTMWKIAMWDLYNFLRDNLKHGDLAPDEDKAYETIRTQMFEILSTHELSLD